MNKINSMIEDVESRIEDTLKEIHQFKEEYNPTNKQYNINLLMVLNQLERNIYTLEILNEDRFEAHKYVNLAISCECEVEPEYNKMVKFLKDRVKENISLFMYLSIYFNLED